MEQACERAKTLAGGPVALARALQERGIEISSQAVSQWKTVPPEKVLKVEEITGVSRHELRPDVFGSADTVSTPAA